MGASAKKLGQEPVRILVVGVDSKLEGLVLSIVPQCCEVSRIPLDFERLIEPMDPPPQLIICGQCEEAGQMAELAQMMRMHYQDIPIIYLTCERKGFDKTVIQKNGFSDAFLLPMESDVLRKTVREEVARCGEGEIKSYRAVKIIDIEPGTVLDFDTVLFLPANGKYIKYSAAGDALEEAQVTRLKRHQTKSLYVDSKDMSKFYKYTADRLKSLGDSGKMSETEKREKTEVAIRGLISDLFNDSSKSATFEHGQAILADCRNIVNEYVLSSNAGDWYKKLSCAMGELAGTYSHSANVSTYASMFSIGLGIGDPAEMAIAGLLHDIGTADVPSEITFKSQENRTPEEQAEYQRHPEHTIAILKKKKISVSPTVEKAILQHHEHFDGSGYPKGIAGPKIAVESQLLALADKFDELTSTEMGKAKLSPKEAVLKLKAMGDGSSGQQAFDPELLKKVLKLFPEE